MCGEIGSGFLSPGLTKKEKGLRLFSCIFRLCYYAWRLCFLSASSDASVFFPFTHVPETTLKPHNFVTLIPFFDPADICLHQFRFAAAPHPCDDLDIPGFSSSFPLKITEEWDIFEMKGKRFPSYFFLFCRCFAVCQKWVRIKMLCNIPASKQVLHLHPHPVSGMVVMPHKDLLCVF